MGIIETFLNLELNYKYYLLVILISIIIGIIVFLVHLKIRNIELRIGNFIFRTFIISAITFVIILVITGIALYFLR